MFRVRGTFFFFSREKLRLSHFLPSNRPHENPRIFSASTMTRKSWTFQVRELNKKITQLIRSGRLDEARTMFDEMTERNTVTWNSMITGYVRRGEVAKARELFNEMPDRDVVTWNLMISGYVSCRGRRYVEEGRELFDQMLHRDFVSWNTMITGYARNGRMDEALLLFNSMPEQNVVSWNALISGFLHNGDVESAVAVFERMPERDAASVNALVSGLIHNGKLEKAEGILLDSEDRVNGKQCLLHAYNTLIVGYGQGGRVDDARRIFDQIPFYVDSKQRNGERFERNVISWNSMIMCYVKAGDIYSARMLFDQMVERDVFSWNTMISGYVNVLDMEKALQLFNKMPDPDTLSWNTMISGFAQMGNLEVACDFFRRMPHKNLVSWNSIISGYEKNADYEGAIKVFILMQAKGEKPDRHTLSSLLSVCAELADLQLGMQIHQQVTKMLIPDVPLNNSLITMYARCGAIIYARAVFDEMNLQKDVISWNAIIGGYASHGFALEALELFGLMKQLKFLPTYITFISVLNACAHAGLVEEGRMHFKSMVSEFGIEPRVEHFASLVDLVGRHGQVEEAMAIIKSMPFEADKAVWGALLGACRVHNNVELAQVAAKALMRLDPKSSAPYVLLYNMYADVGRWDDATKLRMIMERNKIVKEPAYSLVDSPT